MRKSRNDYVLRDLCRIFLGLYELMKVEGSLYFYLITAQ